MALWKKLALWILIQPWFSQLLRLTVSPSITYFESETISSGRERGMDAVAWITAAILPIWFDCTGPGTLIDAFRGFPWLTHVPPPQVAFIFLLFRQAPLVKIVILGPIRLQPSGARHSAGVVDRQFRSVNTLNISTRFSPQVRDRLKMILLLFIFACRLLALWVGINNSLSKRFSGPHGFHFGESCSSLARATWVHSWGL